MSNSSLSDAFLFFFLASSFAMTNTIFLVGFPRAFFGKCTTRYFACSLSSGLQLEKFPCLLYNSIANILPCWPGNRVLFANIRYSSRNRLAFLLRLLGPTASSTPANNFADFFVSFPPFFNTFLTNSLF